MDSIIQRVIQASRRRKIALRQKQFAKLMALGGTFGIISPYGSASAGMSKAESKRRHGLLVGALQKMGYRRFHDMKAEPWAEGEYGERSLLVPGIQPGHLFTLAKQFDQDAVIYKGGDGVLGMYYPREKKVIVAVDPQGDPVFEIADDRSLYSKDRNWSFNFGFAWGNEIPWNGVHPLSRKEIRQYFANARTEP